MSLAMSRRVSLSSSSRARRCHRSPVVLIDCLESRRLLASAAAVTHIYDFSTNTFADTFGGPAITPNGGAIKVGAYNFSAGAGLSLSGVVPETGDYSIEMSYLLNHSAQDAGRRKVLDFRDGQSDSGVYEDGTKFEFDNAGTITASAAGVATISTLQEVIFTRDFSTGQFTCYVNGVQAFQFTDSNNQAIPVDHLNASLVQLFMDNTTGGTTGEESAGHVNFIRVYDGVLTQQQVTDLYTGGTPPGLVGSHLDSNGLLDVNGSTGNDTITIARDNAGTSYVVTVNGQATSYAISSVGQMKISALAGDDHVTLADDLNLGIDPLNKINATIFGDEGNDSIVAGDGDDVVFGGDGVDTLTGGAGDDTIYGNAGKDIIFGGDGRDVLRGNGGNDQIFGQAGVDRLYGYDGADYLDGGSSTDRFYGGGGADTCYGQSGDDYFFTKGDSAIDSVFGGGGNDRAQADPNDVLGSIEILVP